MRTTPWSLRANEVLADGDWHDGLHLFREIEKTITPGVALRRNEANRVGVNRRRSNGSADERRVPRPTSTLITYGKRSIVQAMIGNRAATGTWEVDPWPVPANGYRVGGWRVRDLRCSRVALRPLCDQRGILRRLGMELVMAEPPLDHERVGRILYVKDLPGFEERLEEYRSMSKERRSAAARKAMAERVAAEPARMSLTQLAERSGISRTSAHKVIELFADSELRWRHCRRNSYLPVEQMPLWDTAVQIYREGSHDRRSQSGRRAQAIRRARTGGPPPQQVEETVPTFEDAALNDVFGRYTAGDESLREDMLTAMRTAFHTADRAAGDA